MGTGSILRPDETDSLRDAFRVIYGVSSEKRLKVDDGSKLIGVPRVLFIERELGMDNLGLGME